jgi:1-acyl-sn-glycerol-3-phosphate acyltransferase
MTRRYPSDPTPEQLEALPAHMRRWYRFADFVNRHLKFLSAAWIHTTMRGVLWFTAGNRMKVHGLEHVKDLDKSSRVLMVANHRSFFDFYVVAYANVKYTRIAQRAFFPVRAEFFYEGIIGTTLNWWMTILAMFPPIVRDTSRRSWNRYALKRLEEELTIPGTWVGIHPEGRRNKNAGPYSLLKPHAGTGRIALSVGDIRVVPLYVVGISNNLARETVFNWRRPQDHRIDVYFGPPVNLADLRNSVGPNDEPSHSQSLLAARRCMDAIADLAEAHRQAYNPDHPPLDLPWRTDSDEPEPTG